MTWIQNNSYDWSNHTWVPQIPKHVKEWQREYMGQWLPPSQENFFGVDRGIEGEGMASDATISSLNEIYKTIYPKPKPNLTDWHAWSIFTLQWPMIFNAALIGRE